MLVLRCSCGLDPAGAARLVVVAIPRVVSEQHAGNAFFCALPSIDLAVVDEAQCADVAAHLWFAFLFPFQAIMVAESEAGEDTRVELIHPLSRGRLQAVLSGCDDVQLAPGCGLEPQEPLHGPIHGL